MHTIMIIGAGLVLLAACLALRHWLGRGGVATGTNAFIPLWLLAAGANMSIGVTRAGYTIAQEFPIFLLVFAVPAIVALVIRWTWGRG